MRWAEADIPGQAGRTVVVTGANSGIGFEAARALAQRGASVVLACRDMGRASEARTRILASAPEAAVTAVVLDLASLASVEAAAQEIAASHGRLDLLINNAGVMLAPYATTADGFELQFGTNHLGHFALTGLLLDRLLPVAGSRVVTVASNVHRAGRLDFGDLQSRRHYRQMAAYARSKLANLMFTYELQRRLAAAGVATVALAAHPGTAMTSLTRYLPQVLQAGYGVFGGFFAQRPAMGALPTLRAATDPGARGGEYYGPGGWMQSKGYPRRVGSSARSHDEQAQRRLWQESEHLTGVTYSL